MSTVTPNLWFNGVAEEAAAFYTQLFPGGRIVDTTRYPSEGLPDFQTDMAGRVLTVDFVLSDLDFTAINAGPEFSPNSSVSFMVNVDPASTDDARAEVDRLWAGLTAGGSVLMPLGEYPFSSYYGWVQDRYGFSWQLIMTDPAGEPRPAIIPCLLFGGPQQNRAADAIDFYTRSLPGAEPGNVVPYGEPRGPARADSVLFSEFRLWGQWFAAMDSGVVQDATFNEAISFAVLCDDQAEIDRLWAVLSAEPSAEQCGWCRDAFGVSWQIVPRNMAELMSRPDAYQHMMQMTKLVIDDF